MTRFLTSAALVILLSGCGARSHPGARNPLIMPPAYGTPSQPGATAPVAGECRGAALGQFQGQVATSAVGAAMLQVSGARTIRWVQPGMAVTMEFSPHRLTVQLARGNVIERASCG